MKQIIRVAAFAVALLASPLTAQERPAGVKRLTFDATPLGLSAYYAHQTAPGVYWGGGLGAGGDFLSVMLVGGRHFGEACCIRYQERDAFGGELLLEMAHLDVIRHRVVSDRLEYDVGARASAFLHFDDSDDDPGGGLFFGIRGGVYYGWRNVKLGPQVLAGLFTEQNNPEERWLKEYGVLLTPISVRASFDW